MCLPLIWEFVEIPVIGNWLLVTRALPRGLAVILNSEENRQTGH